MRMLLEMALASTLSTLPRPVRGDFDRDGKADIAEVLANRAGSFILVVSRGAEPKKMELVDTIEDVTDFYLALQKPGRAVTACAKGFGEDRPCKRTTVTTRGDTLAFGTEEASGAVAIWNGKSFEVEWLSD